MHTGRGTTGGAARVRSHEHSFACSPLAHSHIYILFFAVYLKSKTLLNERGMMKLRLFVADKILVNSERCELERALKYLRLMQSNFN